MAKNTVLILGDSTSMSVGMDEKTYPFFLKNSGMWPDKSTLLNCSLPGFTSADAAFFFYTFYRKKLKDLRAVIIYLGNCDAAASEIRKGRLTPLKNIKFALMEILGFHPKKTRLKNRLLHYEWNNQYDPLIEIAESPEDFKYNIKRIIKSCRKAAIPVVLIRPKANLHFPPGIGKGNFLFYRYVNINERISGQIKIPDVRFIEALRKHENGDFNGALSEYENILLTPGLCDMSQEYALVVLNNYAVAKAEYGYADEAIFLLSLLMKEKLSRKEIIYFNLAQIKRMQGLTSEYDEYLVASYEADKSLYRIRAPYVKVLDELADEFKNIDVLDMSSFLTDDLYLDHCHLLPEGQCELADRVQLIMQKFSIHGHSNATILNALYNPELGLGNLAEFNDYFNTYAPYSENQISTEVASLTIQLESCIPPDNVDLDLLEATNEIKNAINYCLRHPCFPRVQDVVLAPPICSSDIGRFPEYFIIRHLIPYFRLHESKPHLFNRFNSTLGLVHGSDKLLNILPEKAISFVSPVGPAFQMDSESQRIRLILDKTSALLITHLKKGNQIFERIKSTIYWYVRESLRFGSHSRISMLYDRLLLEYIAEGLVIAGVLDDFLVGHNAPKIMRLISFVERATLIHEDFCLRFTKGGDIKSLLIQYDEKLNELALELENDMV